MTNYVDPDREQFDRFKSLDRDQQLDMLNLVRLRDNAAYPAGHPLADAALTGSQAYENYGLETGPVLQRVGGSIKWRGRFDATLIGPPNETWDIMFIAHYPNAHAFLAMIADPEYQKAVVHRQAAVQTSRLIRTDALPLSGLFG